MSEVKDKFYDILVPKIVAYSFEFNKSKTSFVKIENGLEYQINFRWDGRGGTTMMDAVEVYVSDVAIQQAIKKRTKRSGLPHVMSGWGYIAANNVKIPVMYSRAALDLANNMNFRGLSQMPQDDKYPPERVLNSAKFVEDLIVNQVFPFFAQFKNSADIYDYLLKQVDNESDVTNFTTPFKDIVQQYAETFGQQIPVKMSE
jgi:hypothetical protein